MNTQHTKILATREPLLCDRIDLRIAHITHQEGHRTVALGMMMMRTLTPEESHAVVPPTISLRPEEAQQFMDELWRIGIRPTEGAGSAGQMAATERHLEDMRRLVFEKKP
jgi:hypothetical protein